MMKNINTDVVNIFGRNYTYEDIDWCVQVGYPVESGRKSHEAMIIGLWNGDEDALREMKEYMDSHYFVKLDDAGRTYCNMMNSMDDLMSTTDARLLYEHYLGLPYHSKYYPELRDELVAEFAKDEKVIRNYVYRNRRAVSRAMQNKAA